MIDLARNSGGAPVSLAEISGRQGISVSYLEQLFALLRRAELVSAHRGPGGGYRLARAPGAIRLSEIVAAVAEPGDRSDKSSDADHVWNALDAHVVEFLQAMSLAEALAGLAKASPGELEGLGDPAA